MLEVKITKHAKKRIKERLGIPKRGFERLLKKVIYFGTFLNVSKVKKDIFFMFYNKCTYIFHRDIRLNLRLITMFTDCQINHYLIDYSKKQ
jgi:hypothetical protein